MAPLFSHLRADGPGSPPRRPCGRPAHPWPLLSERLWQLPLLDCITVHGSQVAAAFKLAYQPVYLLLGSYLACLSGVSTSGLPLQL